MANDYNDTHNKIIESAQNQFLEKGYERTNLREICKGAGVTVGAFYNHFKDKHALFAELVEPCVEGIHQIYDASVEACYGQFYSENFMAAWDISDQTVTAFINFIYDHFTDFHLLLLSSDGTEYSSFVEDLVAIEIKIIYHCFEELEKRNIKINRPPHGVIHMLTHTYFAAVFECVAHDYTKAEALASVDSLVLFFNAGWQKLLGLESEFL